MLGDIIGAAANLFGGFLNRESQREANAINARNAEQQIALQKEFAQSGVQWKVEDARKAGVHPLYALGASTHSFSPVSVGHQADTSLGSAIASSGQDISRAMAATAPKATRVQAIAEAQALEKGQLENDLLRAQIRKLTAQVGPPVPTLTDKNAIPGQPISIPTDPKIEPAPQLGISGSRWGHHPGFSNAEDFEKRYGELSDWMAGPVILWNDMVHNSQAVSKKWWGGKTWYEHARDYFGRRPYSSQVHNERLANARRYLSGRR